ncbi:MAG: phosphopentomutase [Bacillota bacterium]
MERIILIVLDSLGVGELPDAHLYGDGGTNTLKNIALAVGGLNLPNLQSLGLGNIIEVPGVDKQFCPRSAYGKMGEKSPGKDTTTGHWEISGYILAEPFPTYPQGFPKEIIQLFENEIDKKILGNIAASGTEIINRLGKEHIKTGKPIVYTSADSVFQIAAHEDIIPLNKLYEYCKIARKILKAPNGVGRVIARPFKGEPGSFYRTPNRRDFSLEPPYPTILDLVKNEGYEVIAVGKINDIFAGRGITRHVSTKSNMDGVKETIHLLSEDTRGLIFINLVEFDMKYGHRNDPRGYADALEEFDGELPQIAKRLKESDLLIITADHGCDPTTTSTDHSREYVPLLIYGDMVNDNINLGIRETFADVAATIASLLETNPPCYGIDMSPLFIKATKG